jgi:hypothetical protein
MLQINVLQGFEIPERRAGDTLDHCLAYFMGGAELLELPYFLLELCERRTLQ